MSIFNPRPQELCKRAIRAVNKWWLSIAKDGYFSYEFDLQVKVCLVGSLGQIKEDYMLLTHQEPEPDKPVGAFAVPAGYQGRKGCLVEVQAVKLPSGKICIDPWALGHKFIHLLNDKWSDRLGNPDEMTEPEFYQG